MASLDTTSVPPVETFVTPATPVKSTIDPSANIPQRNALNDGGNLPPKDFTTYMPENLPVPPFIFVPGVPNFRDMGGYGCPPPPNVHNSDIVNTGHGRAPRFQVRRGLLFRCAHPTQISQTGLMTLDAMGVTDIYDLRSAPELAKLATSASEPDSDTPFLQPEGHIELPGITRHFTPVYAAEDYSPVALARKLGWYTAAQQPGADYSDGFVAAYRDIGTYGANGGSYAKILRQILRSIDAEIQREKDDAEFIARQKTSSGRGGAQQRPNARSTVRPVSAYADLNGILSHHERFPSPDPSSRAAAAEPTESAPPPPPVSSTTATLLQPPEDNGDPLRQNGGIIFHCTAGKDRTGVLAAVILHLCGVDMEDIAWDYAITEPGLGNWRRMFIERISKSGLGSGQSASDPEKGEKGKVEAAPNASAGGVGGAQKDVLTRAEAARICGSRAGNIRRFLRVVVEGEWGGVEEYLKQMVGLSEAEVEGLKCGLVVRVPDDGEEGGGEDAVVVRRGIEGWSLEGGMDEDREL